MTTGEDGEVLREKIARAVRDALTEHVGDSAAFADEYAVADAVMALIEPVMEENEGLRAECAFLRLKLHARNNSRAALSPSENRDG
jgi:hypothetical protein